MLREQLERGEVGDPITTTLLGVTFWHALAGVAISAGLSIGAGYLMAALNRRHMVSGYRGNEEVAVQRSAQGTPIPDIFGGDPGDGKGGGIKFAPIVAWLSKDSQGYVARKHSFKSGGSGGKGHLFSPAQQSVTQYSYDLDALLLWCRGPAQLRELWAGPDILYRADFVGTDAYYEAEVGTNILAGGAAVISDVAASGGQAVAIPPGGSLTFTLVAGDGSASQLDFFYKSSAPILVQFTWIGGLGTAVFNDTLNSTAGTYTRGYNSAPFVLGNGTGNSVKIKNLDSTNTLTFDRLGVLLADGPVGVPNPSVPTDPSYDPYAPPPPRNANGQPVVRLQGMLSIDPTTNALVGQLGGGNYANVAMYEGNGTELPDPVVQAQEDANRGSGSTIAYRGFCTTRLSNFFLDRYQMAFPPMWGLLQSKTLRTLKDICEWLCGQCGLQPSDYDFTDLAGIYVRGCIANPPYAPADLMETLAEVYDCYFYESDKIYGKRISSAPVVALTDADLAWTDDDREDDQQFVQVLDAGLPAASDVARRVTVRYVSPARNFDQQQQNEYRMISTSNKEDVWDIQVCLADDEARALAARRLYNDEVRNVPYNFTLTDARLYDDPGTIYQITNADGSTHFCTLETIKPTLGVCDCTALEYDSAVFTQVGPAPGIVLTTPPVRAYGSSILGIYDGIALRVNDEGMVGFYAWVTQQTGSGEWTNAALYKEVQGVPDRIASFNAQATAGATVTALGSYPIASIGTEDGTQSFTVSGSTITPTTNYYANGETVMFSGSGTLPSPLNSTTLYYVISSGGNTLQVSLTAGGSAVTLTTSGSGQRLIQRVIDVDLYGTTATLASVTSAQIATGANAALFNNEVVFVRTWQRVVGYANRWRGSNFTRGQRNTQTMMAAHTAGERFVQLDSAVQFVEQAVNQLGVNLQLRAVSEGQVYADAALVQHTLVGGSLQYPPPTIDATLDPSLIWRILVSGVPTTDPMGDRYKVWINGSPRPAWILRGGLSRPVSLSVGPKSGIHTTITGNSIGGVNSTVYAYPQITSERSVASFTYLADPLLSTLTPLFMPMAFILGESGASAHRLSVIIQPQTAAASAYFKVTVDATTLLLDNTPGGEASGTRYSVEFRDGKANFYRNRQRGGSPFLVYTLPSDWVYPVSITMTVGNFAGSTQFSNIQIEDEKGSVLYYPADQIADFGSTQSSLTIQACQQRVVQGVVVDGVVTQVTLP
jgi:hypothetical protein